MKQTIVATVVNNPGVLARVAGLFSRRGFNIASIAVGVTEVETVSRMTIVVDVDEATCEQVTKQLNKLVDVIRVRTLQDTDSVARELLLVKVAVDPRNRSEILETVSIFRANIIDVSRTSMIVEMTGDEDKINAFINLIRPYGIKELARTGKLAMARGERAVAVEADEGLRAV
ncbi:MAG: acetolactate synthase small subunit [Bacillota bacterium]